MAGLAHMDYKYILAMNDWFIDNTVEKEFPKDLIVNFHIYCNDSTTQRSGTKGISPEDYDLANKVKEFVSVVKGINSSLKIINTEFGYDTNNSIQSPKIIGDKQLIQGVWNVRTFLQLALGGIDLACIFNMADEEGAADTNNDWLFNESGIITSESQGWKPKKGYYIVEDFSKTLGGKTWNISFKGETSSGVYNYELTTPDNLNVITITTTDTNITYTSTIIVEDEDPVEVVESKLLINYSSAEEPDITKLEKELEVMMNLYKLNKLEVGWKKF